MKLEKQVCSLRLAKRLKQLGCRQESLFYWKSCNWENEGEPKTTFTGGWKILGKGFPPFFSEDSDISAFTCTELGEMLPELLIDKYEQGQWLNIRHHRGWYKDKKWAKRDEWEIYYSNIFSTNYQGEKQSLVEAMAKMLIYLIENNLIKEGK